MSFFIPAFPSSSSLSLASSPLVAAIPALLLILTVMLRRFSTSFKNKKGEKEERPKENGQANGKRHSLVAPMRKSTASTPMIQEDQQPAGATRDAVESTFEKFSQIIHASQTPLPRQTGDSASLENDTTSGLFGDIKSFGFRDVGTLKDLIKSKASGELVDDKTMLMERIIQVCAHCLFLPMCCIEYLY